MIPIPIADLPKDIDRALVWGVLALTRDFDEEDAHRDWYTADWYGEEYGNYWAADGEGCVNGVTHWMPIPAPPVSGGHQ